MEPAWDPANAAKEDRLFILPGQCAQEFIGFRSLDETTNRLVSCIDGLVYYSVYSLS
jgi:hypothetical protein